jgi:hypothetical protein
MAQSETPAGHLVRKRKRFGCLGCLGQSALVLVLAVVLAGAVTALLFPWAYFMGGKFHPFPYWEGVGKMHGPGGDYALFLRIEPTPRGSRVYAHSNLTGMAYLCTPRGETLPMHLGGEMRPYLHLSTDGEAIHVYVYYWPVWTGQFITNHRPSLDFRGHWQNPNLVLDDRGSLTNAFQADGSVYEGHDRNRPYATTGSAFTLAPGSYSDFKSACAAQSPH